MMTKAEREMVRQLLFIGLHMSNVHFNLKQATRPAVFTDAERERFASLQESWDEASSRMRDALRTKLKRAKKKRKRAKGGETQG